MSEKRTIDVEKLKEAIESAIENQRCDPGAEYPAYLHESTIETIIDSLAQPPVELSRQYKYKDVYEWIRDYRKRVNPITGQQVLLKDITDTMVWDGARELAQPVEPVKTEAIDKLQRYRHVPVYGGIDESGEAIPYSRDVPDENGGCCHARDVAQLEAENAALKKTIDEIAAENERVNDEAIRDHDRYRGALRTLATEIANKTDGCYSEKFYVFESKGVVQFDDIESLISYALAHPTEEGK